MKFDKDTYPKENLIADGEEGFKTVPKSLQILLGFLIDSKVKQNSLGQCLVYASRPRSAILPVPFGLGVQVDHVFGSKWLTNQLFDLGFSISDDEVKLFKQSVLQAGRIEDIIPGGENGFTEWVGDNANHETRTIDGKNVCSKIFRPCLFGIPFIRDELKIVKCYFALKLSMISGARFYFSDGFRNCFRRHRVD